MDADFLTSEGYHNGFVLTITAISINVGEATEERFAINCHNPRTGKSLHKEDFLTSAQARTWACSEIDAL